MASNYSFLHCGHRVNVVFVYPPIPIRSMDWQASYDDNEDSGPVGHGPDAVSAVADLLTNYEAAHFCRRCGEQIEAECEPDGCRDRDCPELFK